MSDTPSSPPGDAQAGPSLPGHSKMSFIEFSNSEQVHKALLEASYAEHEAVRLQALRVLERVKNEEALAKRRKEADEEEKRVQLKEALAKEEIRIREAENRAKLIPKPPPRVLTPPPQAPSLAAAQQLAVNQVSQPAPTNHQAALTPAPAAAPTSNQSQPSATQAATAPRPSAQLPTTQAVAAQPVQQPPASTAPAVQPPQSQPVPASTKLPAPTPSDVLGALPNLNRYLEIHGSLKKLRKFIAGQDPALKKKAGEMRREIVRTMGQLREGQRKNTPQYNKLSALLTEALTIPSPPCDPRVVLVSKPGPVEGVRNNGETMPSLFLYLLNIFSKAVVSQCVNEVSANPKVADPIGMMVHNIFSNQNFEWRNQSFIHILIAKFRVVCPVVFGIRGSEKTEEGRARLGWRKDMNGNWITEMEHNERMIGLGAGYAAICLRNYAKAQRNNPWPNTNYWFAMASIVMTPSEETSPTQFFVLRAMIEHYEKKFIEFYGDMAVAALRVALVDFPGMAPDRNAAVSSLMVLGDKLKKDLGLKL